MSDYDKPEVTPAWAEGGDTNDVPTGAEIQEGWPASNTPPTRQRFNWLLNWLSNGMRYFMQLGIPEWDAEEDYRSGSRVQKADRSTWVALRANTNVEPGTSALDWQEWGAINKDGDLDLYEPDGGERYVTFNKGLSTAPGSALRQWLLGQGVDSSLQVRRFDDDGLELSSPFDINRETGVTRIRNLEARGNPISVVGDGVFSDDAATVGQAVFYANTYAGDDTELFINPHGGIQQEKVTPVTTGSYFADQWALTVNGPSFTAECGVEASALSNYDIANIYCKTNVAKAVLSAGDYVLFGQIFEGLKFRRLRWGTAKARGSWIRFRAAADAAGTASFSISNAAGTRSYVRTFAVTAGEQDYSFFIPADTDASWASATGASAAAYFYICYAATGAQLTATLDAWQAGLYFGGTAQTNFLSATTRKLRVTDFSWKPSAVLLPFHSIDYDRELLKCQRYWESSYQKGTAPGTATAGNAVFHTTAGTNQWENIGLVHFKATKRNGPTITMYSGQTGAVNKIGTTAYGDKDAQAVVNADWGVTLRYNGTAPGIVGADSYTHWVANSRM